MESSAQHKSIKNNFEKSPSSTKLAEKKNNSNTLSPASSPKSTLQTLQAARESIFQFLNSPGKRSSSTNKSKSFFARKFDHFRHHRDKLKDTNNQNKLNKSNNITAATQQRSNSIDSRQPISTTAYDNGDETVLTHNKKLLLLSSNVENKHKLSQSNSLASPLSPNSKTSSTSSSPQYYYTLNSLNELQKHLHKNSNNHNNNNNNNNSCNSSVEYYGNQLSNSSEKLVAKEKRTQKPHTITDIKGLLNEGAHSTCEDYNLFNLNLPKNNITNLSNIVDKNLQNQLTTSSSSSSTKTLSKFSCEVTDEKQVEEPPEHNTDFSTQQNNPPHLPSPSLSTFLHYPSLHSTVVTNLTVSSSSSTASLQSLVLRQQPQEQQPEQEQYQSNQPCDKLGEKAESDLDHAEVAGTISEASKIIKLTAEGEHLKMEDEKLPELDIVNKQESNGVLPNKRSTLFEQSSDYQQKVILTRNISHVQPPNSSPPKLFGHSFSNSPASSLSSSSMSPTSSLNPTLVLSSPDNNSTIKETAPVDIPASQSTEYLSSQNNVNSSNSSSSSYNTSNNTALSTTPTKSETSTPINSRFIIKKIAQSELQKYISTPTNNANKLAIQHDSSKNSTNIQLAQEGDQQLSLKTDPTIVKPLPEPTERLINKFTVKKVTSQDLYASNQSKAEFSDEKLKDDVREASKEAQLDEEKARQLQAVNEASKQQQMAEQKNTILVGQQTSRTNSMSEKNDTAETEREKEQDLLEDEKPIDESPDKRFLKYDTEIGHGSFKTVYKGLDTESGVPVAWCELHDRKFNKSERQRFIEEAEMLKKLQHPNIVRFYDYWEDSKTKPKKIILVTELMTSGTLKAYVQRFKKQEKSKRFKVIKNFANQILKGLAYLHGRQPPVIHRDLKCDNVFVTGQCGQVKIGDLGLATLKKTSFAKSVIGTPEFMAPEMYSEQYDESIDVYAFGMCLLEMATGEYPYQECTKPFEIYKRVTQGIRPENYYRIDNTDLQELIDLCIRLKKVQRPTVKELVNHSWFMDSNGLNLELHKDETTKRIFYTNESHVLFRLKLVDKTKHKNWPDNEAIEFIFDVDNDNPEHIAQELKESVDKINEEDMRYLVQCIKDKCLVFNLERSDRLEEEQASSEKLASAAPAGSVANLANQRGSGTSNASTLTNVAAHINANTTAETVTTLNLNEVANALSVADGLNSSNTVSKTNSTDSNASNSTNSSNLPVNNSNNAALVGQGSETNLGQDSINTTDNQTNYPTNNSQPVNHYQNNNPSTNDISATSVASVDYSINPSNANSINIQQQQQGQLKASHSTSNFDQQPHYAQKETESQQATTNESPPMQAPNASTEMPLRFTIKDFLDTPETGEVVHCVLDLDDRQTINFKFGLNADTPEDITSRLTTATNLENTAHLTNIIKNVIQYINQNKHTQVIKNKQFTAVLFIPSTATNKANTNESIEEQAEIISNNNTNNNQIVIQTSMNSSGGQQQQQQQQQQVYSQQLSRSPHQQVSTNEILKSLQEKQQQITAEINQLKGYIELSSSQIYNNYQSLNLGQFQNNFNFNGLFQQQQHQQHQQQLYQHQNNQTQIQNYSFEKSQQDQQQQQQHEAGSFAIDNNPAPSSTASVVSVYSQQLQQQQHQPQSHYPIKNNVQLINHKQNFKASHTVQNGVMSIHEVPDQNDFELQLLNANRNSSELLPLNSNIYVAANKPSLHYTTNSSIISNNITSPPGQNAVFSTISSTTNVAQTSQNATNILSSSTITSPTVLVNKTNEINLYTTNTANNQVSHQQIQQKIQQISGPTIEASTTSSLYLVNANQNQAFAGVNQSNHFEKMNNPSYAAAINILQESSQSNIVNQLSESLLNMALNNEQSMDHVDFTANFDPGQMNGEQLPQNQNILGNHQMMNNIDTTLASNHVINHLRRNQEQQQLNNNDLAELGERLKSVLTKKNSGELIQPLPQLQAPNQTAADMLLSQQTSISLGPNHSAGEFNILPLSDQMQEFNAANNFIMVQQQNHQMQQNFPNFRVNFQNSQYPNSQPMIDYLNPSSYLANPQTLNCTSSSVIESYQSQPMNLLQSTLIDPSNQMLLQSNTNQFGPTSGSETNSTEAVQENDDMTVKQETVTSTNPRGHDDLNTAGNLEQNVSQTSLFTNNNSSEKSLNFSMEQNRGNLGKDYLGDIFSRHRRELEEVLKRQQEELHEYVMSRKQENNEQFDKSDLTKAQM